MKSVYYERPDGGFELDFAKYCCKDLEEAVKANYVVFGEIDAPINHVCNYMIRKCSYLAHFGHMHTDIKINFCPFCGTKIELVNSSEILTKI